MKWILISLVVLVTVGCRKDTAVVQFVYFDGSEVIYDHVQYRFWKNGTVELWSQDETYRKINNYKVCEIMWHYQQCYFNTRTSADEKERVDAERGRSPLCPMPPDIYSPDPSPPW